MIEKGSDNRRQRISIERRRKKCCTKGLGMRALRRAAITVAAVSCSSSIDSIEGFGISNSRSPLHLAPEIDNVQIETNGNLPRRMKTALMYAPPNHPTTKTAPMVAQAFYSSYKTNRNPTKPRNHQNGAQLSNSVLSASDTLPSFQTAHGLLSPETVMRMEIMTSSSNRDVAVDYFLHTYRKHGPMACLSMLSDPNVLPRLTEAMRDII